MTGWVACGRSTFLGLAGFGPEGAYAERSIDEADPGPSAGDQQHGAHQEQGLRNERGNKVERSADQNDPEQKPHHPIYFPHIADHNVLRG